MKDDPADIVPQLRDMRVRKNVAGLRFRAADEIERLRALIRFEALMQGMTEAEIDRLLTGRDSNPT
jgi:hypothetical protein